MSHCNCHEHSEPRHLHRADSLQKSLQHIQPSTGSHLYCAMAKEGLHEEAAVLAFIQRNHVLHDVITMARTYICTYTYLHLHHMLFLVLSAAALLRAQSITHA